MVLTPKVLRARPVKNPRSYQEMLDDGKKSHPKTLEYLARGPGPDEVEQLRRRQANQQSDAERDGLGCPIQIGF